MEDLDHYFDPIQRGDADAFAAWVARAEPRIRGGLAGFAALVDVEAVVQECLLRVWQAAARFRPDGRPEGSLRWALRIARNLAISEVRRPGPTSDLDGLETSVVPAPSTEEEEHLRAVIRRCFERLPEKLATVLRTRLRSDASDSALAKLLGMKLNTFFQNIRRARLHLAECLKRHGIDVGARE